MDDVTDIQFSVTASGGLFVFIPKKTVDIPMLSTGASTTILIRLFGIGLGKLTELPMLTLTVAGAGITPYSRDITIQLFGRHTSVFMISPDPYSCYPGYTLLSPEYSHFTYLLDANGSAIHQWHAEYIQGIGLDLQENGDLIRTGLIGYKQPFIAGGATGCVERLDWNGSLIWHYEYAADHHGVQVLPNGNILMIAWEYKSETEAIAQGRNPSLLSQGQLWPDHIIEVQPTGPTSGDIVWEWHVWDHLIQDFDASKPNYGNVGEHPELIDINYLGAEQPVADWLHTNAVDYNAAFDQILLCVRNLGEVWVIDHSTTTQEAEGHTSGHSGRGGDLLYRWGNPQAYRAGDATDQQLFYQHDAHWIPPSLPGAGHILVFNNGIGRPEGLYSSVDEIIPPVDEEGHYTYTPNTPYGPENACWVYTTQDPFSMFSEILSLGQRLPNGNTLICNSVQGILYEVSHNKEIVWQYANNIHAPGEMDSISIASMRRYAPDYPGIL